MVDRFERQPLAAESSADMSEHDQKGFFDTVSKVKKGLADLSRLMKKSELAREPARSGNIGDMTLGDLYHKMKNNFDQDLGKRTPAPPLTLPAKPRPRPAPRRAVLGRMAARRRGRAGTGHRGTRSAQGRR